MGETRHQATLIRSNCVLINVS